MIRFIACIGWLLIFLIFSIPFLIGEWILGKFNMDLKRRSSLAIVNWAFRIVIRLAGTKVIVLGQENIPKDTACLYVGNHNSYFDIILTYVRVIRPTGYVAKAEMRKIPLLMHWMKNLDCLFLDRKDIKKGLKTILEAAEKTKNGISITIFPEGTRNKVPDTFMEFHEGSFQIAKRGGVPVVPMCIVNSAAVMSAHSLAIHKATVVIEYCKPFYIKDLDRETQKNLGKYTTEILSEAYFRNKKEYIEKENA